MPHVLRSQSNRHGHNAFAGSYKRLRARYAKGPRCSFAPISSRYTVVCRRSSRACRVTHPSHAASAFAVDRHLHRARGSHLVACSCASMCGRTTCEHRTTRDRFSRRIRRSRAPRAVPVRVTHPFATQARRVVRGRGRTTQASSDVRTSRRSRRTTSARWMIFHRVCLGGRRLLCVDP